MNFENVYEITEFLCLSTRVIVCVCHKFNQIKNLKIVFDLWPLIGKEFLLKYVFACNLNIEKLTARELCFMKY